METTSDLKKLSKNLTRKDNGYKYCIYALIDPRDGIIKYVGMTEKGCRNRLIGHKSEALTRKRKSFKDNWLRFLYKNNLSPQIKILCTCRKKENLAKKEIYWIKKLTRLGFKLRNGTIGGVGGVQIDIVKEKMSNAQKKYFSSEENRKKHSEILKKAYSKKKSRINNAVSKGAKPFIAIKDNVVVGEWLCLGIAAQELNCTKSGISRVLLSSIGKHRERPRYKHRGYIFKYKDQNPS